MFRSSGWYLVLCAHALKHHGSEQRSLSVCLSWEVPWQPTALSLRCISVSGIVCFFLLALATLCVHPSLLCRTMMLYFLYYTMVLLMDCTPEGNMPQREGMQRADGCLAALLLLHNVFMSSKAHAIVARSNSESIRASAGPGNRHSALYCSNSRGLTSRVWTLAIMR